MAEPTQDLITIVLTEPVMINGTTLKPGTELDVEPALWAELKTWSAATLCSADSMDATDQTGTDAGDTDIPPFPTRRNNRHG
jgi:hypothetical protein